MQIASHTTTLTLVMMGLTFFTVGCGGEDSGGREAVDPMPGRGAASVEFVGRASCEVCHTREASLWRGSHHDRAMEVPDEASVLGDFDDATISHFGVTSTFSRRDGDFYAQTEGPDGELADYRIAFTFGFYPLQQYLIATDGGRYQALGLAWDSRPEEEGGQRWFHLYPDERVEAGDRLHWTSADQNWNYMCAECHSTDLQKRYRFDANVYETTWAEIDVSCEACHGPGSAHLTWAEGVEGGEIERRSPEITREEMGLVVPLTEARDFAWVMNPETGVAQRNPPRRSDAEVDACGRCHSRRSVLVEPYEYARPLLDTHRPALLTESLYYHDGQILEEVYVYGSFLQSKMYMQGVTCSDCHEPHSLRLHTEGNTLCGRCHLAQKFDDRSHHFHEPGTEAAACVSCHMPETTYMVVDPRRDHSLRVPRPDLTARIGVPNACSDCHTEQTATWAADAVAQWHGPGRKGGAHHGEVFAAARSGQAGADAALASVVEDSTRAPIVRATALELLGRSLGASSLPVVSRGLDHADPMIRAAAASALEALEHRARLDLLAPLLRDRVRGVRIAAARSLADVPVDLLSPSQSTAMDRAISEYVATQKANAERAEAQINLGLIYSLRGLLDQAESALENALEIDPGLVAVYVNLADLYRQQGRDQEGEALLQQALAIAPEDGDVHYALGLLLVRRGRTEEAVEALRSAADLSPETARYSYAYAMALHSAGDSERALEVLADAHARLPGDPELLLASVTLAREMGDLERAITYAQRLVELRPRDPEARQLLEELEAEVR